jgi:hypothetical protein
MRLCYISRKKIEKKKNYVKFFSNIAFSRFLLESFWQKNCHNSVMVRDNLTILTAISSRMVGIFFNSALSEMLKYEFTFYTATFSWCKIIENFQL